MDIRYIEEVKDIFGKRVLLRLDLNVPFENGEITSDFRIKKSLKTLNFLKQNGAKIIIISHSSNKNQSLKKVFLELNKYIKTSFEDGPIDENLINVSHNIVNGEAIFLENLRFDDREIENNKEFAKELSKLGDIYVNDAFSVMHREHTSIVLMHNYLRGYAGFLIYEEIEALSHLFKPKHPFIVVLGGAKASTKEPLIGKFLEIADTIFIGGALANDFFKKMNYEVGTSITDPESDITPFLNNEKIVLPIQVVVTDKIKKNSYEVLKNEAILDAGHGFIEEIKRSIKNSNTILWNGPLGDFEAGFNEATDNLAKEITKSDAYSIVGGGDTIASIEKLNLLSKFSFVSTGGGAMLDFLSKGTLPGLEVLRRK